MPTAKIRRVARNAARPARIIPLLPLLIAAVALVWTALGMPAPLGAQDPQPGLVFTPAGGSPADGSAEVGFVEGRAWHYSVALKTQPTGTVTVRIRSSSRSVAITRNQQLSFDADNWNTAQDVGYRSQEGSGGGTATLTHTASGDGYENITGAVSVTINSVPKFAEKTELLVEITESGTGTPTLRRRSF